MQQQGNIPFGAGVAQGQQTGAQPGGIASGVSGVSGQQFAQPAGGGIVSGAAGGIPNPYESAIARFKSIWSPGVQTTQALAICNALIADDCKIIGLAPAGETLVGPAGFMSFYQAWRGSFPAFNWSSPPEIVARTPGVGANVSPVVYAWGVADSLAFSGQPFCGIAPTGQSAPFATCARYEFSPSMKIVAMHVVTDYWRLFIGLGVNIPLALAPLAPFKMLGAGGGPETVTTQAVTAPSLAGGAAQAQQQPLAAGTLPAQKYQQQQAVPLAGQPQQQQQAGIAGVGGLQQVPQQQYGAGGLGSQQKRNY